MIGGEGKRMIGIRILVSTMVLFGIFMANPALAEEVQLKARPFDLGEVRLLDGPFKTAQEADEKYLLSLDLDRLLHNFRVNAGLPSTATPLGGWESPTTELRGHFVGHHVGEQQQCAQYRIRRQLCVFCRPDTD